MGSTREGRGNDGTAWAVADFLERFAGVRWYWPAQYGGRPIPRRDSLAVHPAHYRDQPVFPYRTMYQDWYWLQARSFDEGLLRMPPGVLPDKETLPETFHEEHKEMFAIKKDGTRNFNALCYSSQATLDFLLGGCEAVWDKGGACTWVTSTCVTVSPADTAVACQCPACQATYAKGGGDWINGTSQNRS